MVPIDFINDIWHWWRSCMFPKNDKPSVDTFFTDTQLKMNNIEDGAQIRGMNLSSMVSK